MSLVKVGFERYSTESDTILKLLTHLSGWITSSVKLYQQAVLVKVSSLSLFNGHISIFSALGMSLPYVGGMIAGQGMDPRALNAGNLVYPYGSPMMSFTNFSAAYGQGQRLQKNEEATTSDKTFNSSSQLRLVK